MEVDADLNLDLHAFCELHYDAAKVEVTRQALAKFIQEEVDRRAERAEFDETRRRLARESGVTLQLVDGEESREASGG